MTPHGDRQEWMEAAVLLDQHINGKLPLQTSFVQTVFQPAFDLLGLLLGALLMRWAPAALSCAATSAIAEDKAGRKPVPLDAESARRLDGLHALLDRPENRKRPPAVFILMSHPQTVGPEARLLGDLVYHAISALRRLRPAAKLKLIQAIDGFALDMLPWPVKAFYSGLIGAGHLAIDRQPYRRGAFERALYRPFHYSTSAFRILRELRRGHGCCAALAGGVVHNARVFYTAKEFARRAFAAARKKNRQLNRRVLEQTVLEALQRRDPGAFQTGELSDADRRAVLEALRPLGLDVEDLKRPLDDLQAELRLETPHRLRFFRIFFDRLCGRGTPLLLVPLRHEKNGAIRLGRAALARRYRRREDRVEVMTLGEETFSERATEEFAKEFVREELNGPIS